MAKYEPVIGLEVHAQIHTASKMFCTCPVVEDTGDLPPNTYVCPTCTGMPGALPTVNQRAVELGILTGLALNCTIPLTTAFARKSYFYPDLPKGYQISQHARPLAVGGHLDIAGTDGPKRIGINNVHLEEDAGKLYHLDKGALVDLNRAGVPLIEIVTEPEIRSAEEARTFASDLRLILIYLGISSGDMEKGVMRFEASVSVRPTGSDELNPRHEIKNLNSFRSLTRAIDYEIDRQIAAMTRGKTIVQQTLGWDESAEATYIQRSKEFAADYRYFPEPDLPSLEIDREWIERVRRQLPELPAARRQRFVSEYGLGKHEAGMLVMDKDIGDYFEAVVASGGENAAIVVNWIVGDLFRLANEVGEPPNTLAPTPEAMVELIALVESGTINRNTGQAVLRTMVETDQGARHIVDEQKLSQISDDEPLLNLIESVLEQHPTQLGQYLQGKEQVADWLMGQLMRAARGRADPHRARELLLQALEECKKHHR